MITECRTFVGGLMCISELLVYVKHQTAELILEDSEKKLFTLQVIIR